eukprot:6415043-Amphidinium_carterae.3
MSWIVEQQQRGLYRQLNEVLVQQRGPLVTCNNDVRDPCGERVLVRHWEVIEDWNAVSDAVEIDDPLLPKPLLAMDGEHASYQPVLGHQESAQELHSPHHAYVVELGLCDGVEEFVVVDVLPPCYGFAKVEGVNGSGTSDLNLFALVEVGCGVLAQVDVHVRDGNGLVVQEVQVELVVGVLG